MSNLLKILQDPSLVCQFQSLFGVEKVAVVEKVANGAWIASEIKEDCPENIKELGKDKNCLNSSKKVSNKENGCLNSQVGNRITSGTEKDHNTVYYKISNRFWYNLFVLGSLLGHEAWYAFVYSFLFWNVDGAVGRRVILVGNFVFYIGQGMKDIIRWPRPPMPPVVRLEQRWEAEYGMPSTHAMMALSLPLSVIIFTAHTPLVGIWLAIGSFWCVVVCCCRVYLGMHSVADIVVGLTVSSFILLFAIPIAHYGDVFLLSSPLAPMLTLFLSALSVVLYPGSYKWTPAWGETTYLIGGYFGTHVGSWLSFQLGLLQSAANNEFSHTSPQSLIQCVCLGVLRVLIGLVCLALLRMLVKPFSFQTACWLLRTDMETLQRQEFSVENKKKLAADLFCKFVTFSAIGFGITLVAPLLFEFVGCGRPSYWTEIFPV